MGLGPVWRFGCGTGEREWVWDQREWGGCLCQETVPIYTSAEFWSSQVGCGKVCTVPERRGTRAGPTAGQPCATIRSSLSLGQHR